MLNAIRIPPLETVTADFSALLNSLGLDEAGAEAPPRLRAQLVAGDEPTMSVSCQPSSAEGTRTSLSRDRSYEQEVLGLLDGSNEDDLDAKCTSEARDLGILPYKMEILQELASNLSGLTLPASPRRSTSLDSRGSRSTGIISDVSRSSKEQQPSQNSRSQRPVHQRTNSRTSLSVRDYDLAVGHIKPTSKSSLSTPATTPAQSTTSLPLGSPRRHFSRMRRISQWSKIQRYSKVSLFTDHAPLCPCCPHDRPYTATHRLPCQHVYCTPTLRKIIKESTIDDTRLPPNCCDTPIPGKLIERVLKPEELDEFLNNMASWDDSISFSSLSEALDGVTLDGTTSEHGSPSLRLHCRTTSNGSSAYAQDWEASRNLDRAIDIPDFRALRQQHESERDRFLKFLEKQRQAISAKYEERKRVFVAQKEPDRLELEDKHQKTVAAVEEKHISDELDMLAAHEAETRSCDLKLRHMEAYCYPTQSSTPPRPLSVNMTFYNDQSSSQCSLPSTPSPPPSSPVSPHKVTEQDLRELSKQYWLRDNLPARHTAAINVLRGEQAQRLRKRYKNNELELTKLEEEYTRDLEEIDKFAAAELIELTEWARIKRRRLQARWDLQEAGWRKRHERDTEASVKGPIKGIRWPEELSDVSPSTRGFPNGSSGQRKNSSTSSLQRAKSAKEFRREMPSPALSGLSEKGTKLYLVP
ncbi:MAG: hypothetical protein M1820_003732 [Bogoriella megaspora]|nr:MAG: hypothetical protein M1820_003732 [Bogoriella megaspora]